MSTKTSASMTIGFARIMRTSFQGRAHSTMKPARGSRLMPSGRSSQAAGHGSWPLPSNGGLENAEES